MARSTGISNTTEWKLIYALRQNIHNFSHSGRTVFDDRNRRTIKLRTALSDLNIQIHTTFTVLQLESLLLLEAELEDDESSQSSDSESDEELYYSASEGSDRDDSSSHSSEMLSDAPSNSRHMLYNKAITLLSDLCSFLEGRVNSTLIEPRDSDQSVGYPRLSRLLGYVSSPPDFTSRLNFVPIPDPRPIPFLFNISKDGAGADAFIAFSNSAQSLPDKETRRHMLAEIMVMRDHIFTFNNFVNSLKISMGSLDNLAARSNRITSTGTTFASFSLLQKFRQQAAAARRAMFSHFKQCTYRGSAVHNVYLQLPGWEDVSDCHSRDAIETQMAQLFFIKCPNNDWQHARMYFLQTMHANACKKLKLCKALRNAYDNKRDLEFYISENVDNPDSGEIPIHIPIDPKRGRRYGESFPDDSISLWTLIKQGYFAREESIDLWLGTEEDTILGFDQRKALAIRLVLGLMLSMDSDHVIDTWDPKQIHFLKPRDVKLTPFVPIDGHIRSSNIRNRLFLTKLDMSDEMGDEYSEPTPLPPFVLLAKALLHIARGERLETLKVSYKSENAFRDACNRLHDVVERYIKKVINGNEVDREVLPFLIAARNCLRFHTQYQLRLNTEESKHKMEIAWKLVFEEILAKIDSSLVLEKPVQASINASVREEPRLITDHKIVRESSTEMVLNRTGVTLATTVATKSLKEWAAISSIGTITAQPEVMLFDGEDSIENPRDTERARAFFEMLDNFHSSYSRFVTDRITTPRRIRIAILDTGIDFQHAGIMQAKEEGRMKEEWCYSWVGDDVRDEDDELHGTNCAYLLHKAAPEAEIYVEKVFQHNSFKVYQAQNIAKAIEHAVRTWDVDVISMSFGLTPPVPRIDKNLEAERLALQQFEEIVSNIETAIHDALAASPRIIFAAASNNGKNGKRAFPAKYGQGVICVHASDGNGTDLGINPPTESGANLMTLGMGLELYRREWVLRAGRRVPAHKKTYKSGTSFATPIAAGIAATVLDLANRVKDINDRTRDKLKRAENMEKMFLKLMSSPNHSSGDHYSFLAPWHLWETHWEANLSKSQLVWGKMNDLFAVDGFSK